MLLIFVDQISERLIYTFDFIFKDRSIAYRVTNDWLFFCNQEDVKFVYSEKFSEDHLQIKPSTLLFDEAIFTYSINKAEFYKEESLSFDGIIDPVASIFYILTRYEEYLVKQRDEHDRFEAKNSLLSKFNWLEKVICDRMAEDLILFLEEKLEVKFVKTKIPAKLSPTFDIDNTFAFKWKGSLQNKLSYWRDKLRKDTIRLNARRDFTLGKIQDPYDSYDALKNIENLGLQIKMFWLIGDRAKFDKNISANDPRHQTLIREMSHFGEIGLHPSYKSNSSIFYLKKEQQLLKQILKKDISSSRQHFLKLSLPNTYQSLISLGFTNDYSMGFADAVGFRAGTSRPFLFFDLIKNAPTKLWIHPFAFMDGSLNLYLKLTPNQAKEKISTLFKEVKKYGGDFVFIWHNETITDFGPWKSWKSVFDYCIDLRYEV